jgi:putative lysine transport system substrate-binding protein
MDRLQSGPIFILRKKLRKKSMRRMMCLILAAMMLLSLTACGDSNPAPTGANIPGSDDNILTVGMECAYAPYNWTQMDDSNGAVPIVNNPGMYANGYDVQIAKKIAEANGWGIEIMALEWGGLTPALEAGIIDVAIAGQSMTAERMAEVDMAGPYYYATIVCLARVGTPQAAANSISDLFGTCTSQSGTIWYDTCLPQIEGAELQAPAADAPAMIMALESGMVDFICTDLPTANGAVAKNPDLVVLNFSGTSGDFQFANEAERAENVNIGVSVKKGNSELQALLNQFLSTMTEADFNRLMEEAIAVQPSI